MAPEQDVLELLLMVKGTVPRVQDSPATVLITFATTCFPSRQSFRSLQVPRRGQLPIAQGLPCQGFEPVAVAHSLRSPLLAFCFLGALGAVWLSEYFQGVSRGRGWVLGGLEGGAEHDQGLLGR
eukprot:12449171-Prorocentrum_lima.AAC.1